MTRSGKTSVLTRKSSVILAVVVFATSLLAAGTATWLDATLSTGNQVSLSGFETVPALTALTLACLALAAATSLAGRVMSLVLSVLLIALGLCLMLAMVDSLADPVNTLMPAISEQTGIAGSASVSALVVNVDQNTPVVILGYCLSSLITVTGMWMIWSSRSWQTSRKYRRAITLAESESAGPIDAMNAWDELSAGDDPTEQFESLELTTESDRSQHNHQGEK